MSFVHEDDDFQPLLGIVAQKSGIAAALIEKDYWVTHTLWALHQTGLEVWFKGGTSLSKGFRLIERFSEDLDLMIEAGSVTDLPLVSSWTSKGTTRVAERRAYYDALTDVLVVPGVVVKRDETRIDDRERTADYLASYPGALLEQLTAAVSPFVRLEVGRARVVPHVEVPLSSFVHDYLEQSGALREFDANRPTAVRCVHPFVTLIEKLDAMARRYGRDEMEADSFVRHYEDAAQIIRGADRLPEMPMTVVVLIAEMLGAKEIGAAPRPDEPALLLADAGKRAAVERAYEKIEEMFWGPRIPLDEACLDIRQWLAGLG